MKDNQVDLLPTYTHTHEREREGGEGGRKRERRALDKIAVMVNLN